MKGTCPYGILHKKLFELQHLLYYNMCKTDSEIQQINGRITDEIPAKLGFLKTLLGIEMESPGSDKAHLQQIADWLSTIEAWSNAQPNDGVFAALPFCSVCAKDNGGVSDLCLCNDSCFGKEGINEGVSDGDRHNEEIVSNCERKEGGGRKVGCNKCSIFFKILVAVAAAAAATIVGIVTIRSMEEEEVMLLPS